MAFSRGRSTETRLIHLGLFLLLTAGFATSRGPAAAFWGNTFLTTVFVLGGLWVVVALVRRELRIRRRLDAIRNEPAPTRHTDTRHWRTSHPTDRRDAA